jgi:hypothetical protein
MSMPCCVEVEVQAICRLVNHVEMRLHDDRRADPADPLTRLLDDDIASAVEHVNVRPWRSGKPTHKGHHPFFALRRPRHGVQIGEAVPERVGFEGADVGHDEDRSIGFPACDDEMNRHRLESLCYTLGPSTHCGGIMIWRGTSGTPCSCWESCVTIKSTAAAAR